MYDHAEETTPMQEQLPIIIDAKIRSLRTSGSALAHASVTLNGCFAVRGLSIIRGENGPFVSMPSYRSSNGYKDVCFPINKDFREQMHAAVLNAYRQEMAQLAQRGQLQEPQEAPFSQQPQQTM